MSRATRPLGRAARAAAVALLCAGAAGAGETPSGDAENPRNARFTPPFVEFLAATPRVRVEAVGDRGAWAEGADVQWQERALDLEDSPLADGLAWRGLEEGRWTVDGRPREPRRGTSKRRGHGATTLGFVSYGIPWTARPGRQEVALSVGDDRCAVATDALRVLLVVERKTLADGDRRFGSFVRRFRKSLDDLHALFAASVHPLAPRGVEDRFRIDAVRVFDRSETPTPPEFASHPEFDVAIVCDEGGPLAGFSIPEYSIGHDFVGPPEHRGLWSSWGEQALWHELLHFRGVQDFYAYEIADGALPGRVKGALPLPARYAGDLLASPYQAPAISEYTAVVANSKRGVARVGACEDTENARFGHMWNWLPGRVDLFVTRGGAPARGAAVRWWRSLPRTVAGGRTVEAVEAERAPDRAATTDAEGRAVLSGDLLGRARPRAERSRWLLVEAEVEGERRFEVVYGLDLNLAYARGDKYGTAVRWRFEDLLRPGDEPRKGR